MWTIDELVRRVAAALAAQEVGEQYQGAPNGRVRDVPDRRAVRWYATTGLVDRPSAMRGRTALYGPRHLLQLVAVKRLQAAGKTLAEVQAELAGATDPVLAGIARVPADLLESVLESAEAPPQDGVRPRFWADPVATPAALGGGSNAVPLHGVALPGGAVLLVPGAPSAADCAEIAAAARPLLDLLSVRGLLTNEREPS